MKKFDNFCHALANLEDIYKYEEPYDNVILTGLVGLFEICFEQSWKMIKEVLEYYGYPESATGSPRQILKTAYKAGMLQNEAVWLSAIEAGNNSTHAYNREIAIDIVHRVKNEYFNMFQNLKSEIQNNWSDFD